MFAIEDRWLKTNLKTREKYFYNRTFQQYITGEDNTNKIIFHVSVGSANTPDFIDFHPYVPATKYVQHDKNNLCFISLASAIYDAR